MFDPPQLSPDEWRHFYRRAAIAPLCLCLVAGLQVSRVWRCNQTPWKGGGFGMFSTVDAESARFLKCYLVTDQGELPLPVPEDFDKREAELRAAPTVNAAKDLANRLASRQWRWRDERQRRELASIRSKSIGVMSIGSEHALEPVPESDQAPGGIDFTAVRVECWRHRFDASSAELRPEKMLDAAASRQEPAR